LVAKRFVEVVFVPVALVQVSEVVPRFVTEPLVTKRFVLVVFVPVAFVHVTPLAVRPYVPRSTFEIAPVYGTKFERSMFEDGS
jgi:hypothetical protein